MKIVEQCHAHTVFTLYSGLNNTDETSETVGYNAESHMMMIMVIIIASRGLIRYRTKYGGLFKCTRVCSEILINLCTKLVDRLSFESDNN